MDQFGNLVDFVVRGVEEWEGVGGFVADGSHTESTNLENMIPHAGLAIRNILDLGEFNDVGGVTKERGADGLDGAAISDVEMIGVIDDVTGATAEEKEEI